MKAHAPIVNVSRIVKGPGPAYGGRVSYYDHEADVIYWIPWPGGKRHLEDLYHELGHAFDPPKLTPKHRHELKKLLGRRPRAPWFWKDRDPMAEDHHRQPVMEDFADAYAQCCLHRFKQRKLRRYLGRIA